MGLQNKIAQYREYKNGVSHCTFNPEGPGVVRIHTSLSMQKKYPM